LTTALNCCAPVDTTTVAEVGEIVTVTFAAPPPHRVSNMAIPTTAANTQALINVPSERPMALFSLASPQRNFLLYLLLAQPALAAHV
jgi:hypothetical protein